MHAHLNKRDMVVELNIHYYRDIPWDLAGIETEIFERLHRAYMFVEPVEEPGFLIEHITNIKMMLGRLWFSAPLVSICPEERKTRSTSDARVGQAK